MAGSKRPKRVQSPPRCRRGIAERRREAEEQTLLADVDDAAVSGLVNRLPCGSEVDKLRDLRERLDAVAGQHEGPDGAASGETS